MGLWCASELFILGFMKETLIWHITFQTQKLLSISSLLTRQTKRTVAIVSPASPQPLPSSLSAKPPSRLLVFGRA